MSADKPVEICVVEDHEKFRDSIVFMIDSHPGFNCFSFKSAEAALAGLKNRAADVIIMDINLPGMNGIECTRIIKEIRPEVLIMMCTVFEDPDNIFDALKAGASGYILKRTAGEVLIEAIKDLMKGGAPMSSEIARMVVNSFGQNHAPKPVYAELTNKENEILRFLAAGHGNKEIAGRLFISVNTVRTHIYHIYEKLHVHNRIEALNKFKKDAG